MRQPHKMVKHNQEICRQQPKNCLSVSDHFVGLALKGLITLLWCVTISNEETIHCKLFFEIIFKYLFRFFF